MRVLPPSHYTLLKSATKTLIGAAGGVEPAAALTRVGKSNLSDYARAEHGDCFMPIDVALDLSLNTGNLVLLEACAVLTSTVLLPADSSTRSSTPQSIALTSAQLMSETADVLRSTAKALKDGKVTPREQRDITLQVQQTITACVSLLTTLKDHGAD